jgi:long-chain acyl-CoA synthetase
MQKIWLKNYPPGVPAEIDPNEIRSLRDMIESSCAQFADRTAFVQMNRSLKYRELEELSRRFGAWLQHKAGLKRGDRVAIMLPNVLQYPIAMLGALRAGLTVVNTNPLYTARELEHQLHDSGAVVIIILENFAHVLQEVLPRTSVRHVLVTAVGDMLGFPLSLIVNYVVRHRRKQVPSWDIDGAHDFKAELEAAQGLTLDAVELNHADLAFLQYTGGTTGVAKGAELTHRNICANVLQSQAWIGSALPGGEPDVLITPIPLYHIFALTVNCMLFLRLGVRGAAQEASICLHQRREHTIQRVAAHARIRDRGFQPSEDNRCRCDGGAGRGCTAMEGRNGESHHAGVGSHRDLTGGVHQSAAGRLQRLDRATASFDRDCHQGRCWNGPRHQRGR